MTICKRLHTVVILLLLPSSFFSNYPHFPLSKWLILNTYRDQIAVTEFLFLESKSAANIYGKLVNV